MLHTVQYSHIQTFPGYQHGMFRKDVNTSVKIISIYSKIIILCLCIYIHSPKRFPILSSDIVIFYILVCLLTYYSVFLSVLLSVITGPTFKRMPKESIATPPKVLFPCFASLLCQPKLEYMLLV
jgi:hypothetical protein